MPALHEEEHADGAAAWCGLGLESCERRCTSATTAGPGLLACEQHIAGENVTMMASMAKLKAGRLTREVADSCLQYWGGNGFMWENPASQLYRDGRLGSIGGGADEIMLGIICKLMDILPKKQKG